MPDYTNPQSFNRYSYVLNNPLKYTDPSGYRDWNPLHHLDNAWEWFGDTVEETTEDISGLFGSYGQTMTGNPGSWGEPMTMGGRTSAAHETLDRAADIAVSSESRAYAKYAWTEGNTGDKILSTLWVGAQVAADVAIVAEGAGFIMDGLMGPLVARGTISRGVTVIGHYPEYVTTADKLGASRFYVPKATWDTLTNAQRWKLNREFLDLAIQRGDDFILATPGYSARPGSTYAQELAYLGENGYSLSVDGTKLIKGS